MRFIRISALLLSVLSASAIRAQQVDGFIGLGTNRDSSNGQSINTFGDGTLYNTPTLGGLYTEYGANVFFSKQLGIGWTLSWRAAHDYAGLQYRPSFNTFDAIYQPTRLRTKRSVPELRAGIGVASIHVDAPDDPSCSHVTGCPSSHHFLGHVGVATRLYLTHHVFLRPAVDVQYVKNFFQFGSNWVPRYSMCIGYSFGRE